MCYVKNQLIKNLEHHESTYNFNCDRFECFIFSHLAGSGWNVPAKVDKKLEPTQI
jgi:hypothetical protein